MPCRVGDCRLSQAETAAVSAMWDSDQFCGKQPEAFVDARLEGLGSPSSLDQSALMTFGCTSAAETHCALLGQIIGEASVALQAMRAPLSQRSWGSVHALAFVLGLQSPVFGGLVQLKSDELLSDAQVPHR